MKISWRVSIDILNQLPLWPPPSQFQTKPNWRASLPAKAASVESALRWWGSADDFSEVLLHHEL